MTTGVMLSMVIVVPYDASEEADVALADAVLRICLADGTVLASAMVQPNSDGSMIASTMATSRHMTCRARALILS